MAGGGRGMTRDSVKQRAMKRKARAVQRAVKRKTKGGEA